MKGRKEGSKEYKKKEGCNTWSGCDGGVGMLTNPSLKCMANAGSMSPSPLNMIGR